MRAKEKDKLVDRNCCGWLCRRSSGQKTEETLRRNRWVQIGKSLFVDLVSSYFYSEGGVDMNILIINCSPVRNGATAEIVNLVKEHVEEGNVVKSVCIDDYDIKLCKGCRKCHETAKCFQEDDVDKLMVTYDWADKIVSVSPSYWADIPGQFKVFIDRCTPWCNTHQPHAKIKSGKKGYTIALRTGPSMPECERIISSIEHFHGHLEIESCGKLGLCGIEYKEDLEDRKEEIKDFCELIKNS